MLKIRVVNTGYGEAIYLESETENILIDGGSGMESEYERGESRIRVEKALMYLGVDHIDNLIISHIHEDHVSGLLSLSKNMKIKRCFENFIWPGKFDLNGYKTNDNSKLMFSCALKSYGEVRESLEKSDCKFINVNKNKMNFKLGEINLSFLGNQEKKFNEISNGLCLIKKRLDEGDIESFEVELSNLDRRLNNLSLMSKIEYRDFKAIFPGDTNKDGLYSVKDDIKADFLKLGHHGQIDAIDTELIKRVDPKIVLICASSERKYNSARPEIVDMLKGRNIVFSDLPDYEEFKNEKNHCISCIDVQSRDEYKISYIKEVL